MAERARSRGRRRRAGLAGTDPRIRRRHSSLLRTVAFLALTGTLTFFIGAQIARLGFGGGYQVVAAFDDASGLQEGDQVKVAGAPVGRVDSIKVREGRAEVRMSVNSAHRLPRDSEAAIRWRSAVGQRVVYLVPGTAPERLRDGDRIARTRSVVDIGELVNRLEPLTRSLDPEQVNRILTAIYLALDGNEENVSRLLVDVERLSSTIAARRQTLATMLADFSTVTGIIARRDQQIAKMTDDLVTLSRAFVDNRALVDRALVELSVTLRTTDRVAGRNAAELARVVEQLSTVLDGTRRNLDPLRQTVALTGPKLQRLHDLFDEGQFVVGAVPCLTLAPGKCPYPMKLTKPPERPMTSPASLRGLIGGGTQWP
ncbi:MCE family protein [Actinomadura craniellae]|uniref:MCE family protein n=1 Tax=Actinomadura craniellae TaxID=2231787 RepID=A0A365HBD1_9ACTN|nr:MCE family protein [Actinomadura craniellae]RAY16236.1 MCE family protein [Actinomadura craniellae]